MCVIERRLYPYTDGRRRTVETTRLCNRARGNRACDRVERRSVHEAHIVERRPSTADGPLADGFMVTEGVGGRTRVYRDLSNRSSLSSSIRRSRTQSERSPPTSIPSSASSPPVLESTSSPPRPFDTVPTSPTMERTRAPYPPPPPPELNRTVTADGTAIYDRPPSLEMPRAADNERRRPPRRASNTSMTAEVDDSQPGPSNPPRRHRSVRIDDPARPSSSARPNFDNNARRASDRDRPRRHDSRRDGGQPPANNEDRDRARAQGEQRQAELERERLANSDRRQEAREAAARERHRREAAEALEGNRPATPAVPIDDFVASNYEQMARERAAREDRRRSEAEYAAAAAAAAASPQYTYPPRPFPTPQYTTPPYTPQPYDPFAQYADAQLRRDREAHARYYSARQSSTSTRPSSSSSAARRMTGDAYAYPTNSPRISPLSARSSGYRPVVHQSRRNSFAARGDDVIAREQARAEAELDAELGGMSLEDERELVYDEEVGEYVAVAGSGERVYYYYVDDGGQRRRRERRWRSGR